MFPGPQTGPGTPEQHHGRLPRQPQAPPSVEKRAPADTPAGRHHQPSQELPVTIISRRLPAAPETAADIEYGILANQLTMAIYPDLVFDTAPDASRHRSPDRRPCRHLSRTGVQPHVPGSRRHQVARSRHRANRTPGPRRPMADPCRRGSVVIVRSVVNTLNRHHRKARCPSTPRPATPRPAAPSGSARTGTPRRSTLRAAPTLPTWTPSRTVPTHSAAGSTLPSAPTPTSARNAELRSADSLPPETKDPRGKSRSFIVAVRTVEALETALIADRRHGRVLSRGAFVSDAVRAAARHAQDRYAGPLPPAPARLPNRPPRANAGQRS